MRKIINLINKITIKTINLKKYQDFKNKNNSFQKILIISNTALGDTILSTPVIKTLKKNLPNSYITLIVNKKNYNLFKNYTYIDNIMKYNKSIIGLFKHIFHIRKNKYDSIFFLHSNGPEDLFIALFSGVKNIHKAINYPNNISNEFKKLIMHEVYYSKKQHIIEHRLDTIRYLNFNYIDKRIDIPKFFYKKKVKHEKITIGLQLSANDLYKVWPIINFIELSKLILKDKNVTICLFGLQNEDYLAKQIEDEIKNCNQIINYCGKTTIQELPQYVNSLDLLITNDTGTLHLAVALRTRTISLFSPTDSKIFGPHQDFDLHYVIQKKYSIDNIESIRKKSQEAMTLISVEEVFNAYKIQLKKIKKCVA